jgi:4-hydroxy-tetrahydrodipicolinate reductase
VSEAAASLVRTVIVGAAGRMGGQLLRCLHEFPPLVLHGALAEEGHPSLGKDASALAGLEPSGVPITSALAPLLESAGLVIDFSHPAAAPKHLADCVAARVPMLIGTTGLPADFDLQIEKAARTIAVMRVANTSLGVNVLLQLVRQAARQLPPGYDIEIVETHHRGKRDAPSGTALALGKAAADGRGIDFSRHAVYDRQGMGEPRDPGAIALVSMRGGDVVGEHEVRFLGDGERVFLSHSATDRVVFARGALTAGRWLAARPAGRYAMNDFFDYNSEA